MPQRNLEGDRVAAPYLHPKKAVALPSRAALNTILEDPDLLFTADAYVLADGDLGRSVMRARRFMAASRSVSTRKSYTTGLLDFVAWCDSKKLEALPASQRTILLYLAESSKYVGPSTLRSRCAAINRLHVYFGLGAVAKSLPVLDLMRGVERLGPAPVGKDPIKLHDLHAIGQALDRDPRTIIACRNRALIYTMFHFALRRSEAAAIEMRDLQFDGEGMRLHIRSSKTDQTKQGTYVRVGRGVSPQTCPVFALQEWISARGFAPGPVFCRVFKGGHIRISSLDTSNINRIVKELAVAVGFDLDAVGSHSLRAGFITSAYEAGIAEGAVMDVTRQTSIDTLRHYRRNISPWLENLTQRLGC